MTLRVILLVVLSAAVSATGCVGFALNGAEPEPEAAPATLVWPPAPEIPRIRYLHSIASERDIGVHPGLMTRLLRFLKGAETTALMRPHGLAIDGEERLYVVDTFYRRIHAFDRAQGVHYIFPAIPPEGFVNPIGVAAGVGGRVFVSDSEAKVIHVFSAHGRQYEGSIGAGLLERPTGLAYDAERRRLLVTDTVTSTLLAFSDLPALDERLATNDVRVDTVDGIGMHGPTHVVLDRAGGVVLTDSLNFRVLLLNRGLGYEGSFGMAGNVPGYFSRPKGVAVDSAGHIYVVDALFANVQIFDTEGQLLLAFGRPGTGPGEFWLPNDIFIDGLDRIYVSDSYNQRVQVFQYLHHEDAP